MDSDSDMEMEVDEVPVRMNRFKHQSYAEQLKSVHAPTALDLSKFDTDIGDNESHFYVALQDWKQLNLTIAFTNFAKRADGLALSMPLLLHNWKEIVNLWTEAVKSADDDGLRALLDLLQKLAHDLRTTLSPSYTSILSTLTALLPRGLETQALTALLAALSSVFRHLLVPSLARESEHPQTMLVETWTAMRDALVRCGSETRRAVAEVWAGAVRRMKSAARAAAVRIMVRDMHGVEDAAAWVVVEGCKSVSQTLHTAASSIVSPILDYLMDVAACSGEDAEAVLALLRRSITALVHHCKGPEQFAPLADVLVARLGAHVPSITSAVASVDGGELGEQETERLRRSLLVCAVACSVRQGSRMGAEQLSILLAHLPALPLIPALQPALLQHTSALLFASYSTSTSTSSSTPVPTISASSTSASRAFLARALSVPALGVPLLGTLSDLGYAHFKLLARPLLIQHTPALLSSSSETEVLTALRLLSALHKAKKLGEVDVVWRRTFDAWASERIGRVVGLWSRDRDGGSVADGEKEREGERENAVRERENAVRELSEILGMIEYAPSAGGSLVALVDALLGLEGAEEEYARTWANAGVVLGMAMRALGRVLQDGGNGNGSSDGWKDTEKDVKRKAGEWTRKVIDEWAWCEGVMEGLGMLLQTSPDTTLPSFSKLYPTLRVRLLSHSRVLRLQTLRLLARTQGGPQDAIHKCLQGEEVALDVAGVRERVMRIGRVGTAVKEKGKQKASGDAEEGEEEHGEAVDVCARWLVAQLKVNLRPLWSPACAAIAALVSRFGDPVWHVLFDELRAISTASPASSPEWTRDPDGPSDTIFSQAQDPDAKTHAQAHIDDPWEDERTWRDPSAHKARETALSWLQTPRVQRAALVRLQAPATGDRLDVSGYEGQLLAALSEGGCLSVSEKHNRELVELFLVLVGPNGDGSEVAGEGDEEEDEGDAEGEEGGAEDDMQVVGPDQTTGAKPRKMPRTKMHAWLTLFGKFVNPKAIYASETLRTLYLSLLAHPDRTLQRDALACMLSYRPPHLLPYAETFQTLLDDAKGRDALASLDFASVEPQARPEFVGVAIRLLFGLMRERRGKSRIGERRAAVLGALAACSEDELALLVDLMLAPLGTDSAARREGEFRIRDIRGEAVSPKVQVGFLNLLGDVLKNLGPSVLSYWPALVGATMDLVGSAHGRLTEKALEGDEEAQDDTDGDALAEKEIADNSQPKTHVGGNKNLKLVRHLGMQRLVDFFTSPLSFDFAPFLSAAFPAFLTPRIMRLDTEQTQAPTALLALFQAWASRREYAFYLVQFDAQALPKLIAVLIAPGAKPAVLSRVFDIVDRLLALAQGDTSLAGLLIRPHASLLLGNLATLVERAKGDAALASPLVQREIGILTEIAPHLADPGQASTLLQLLLPLLRKTHRIVPEKTKVDLLRILVNAFPLVPDVPDADSALHVRLHEMLASLFLTLRYSPARKALVATFKAFAKLVPSLSDVTVLLEGLNAYSVKRLDEPDFDKRLTAFTDINERFYKTATIRDWLPVLYNALHFIQDPEELAVRNSAGLTFRRFLDFVADPGLAEHNTIFQRVVYPSLKKALRSKHELVRAEILGVIAYGVSTCTHLPYLNELTPLLAGGDEEASFFANIHHIQVHRRSRALRRLAEHCDNAKDSPFSNRTLADVLLPLVEHYVISTRALDHHLVTEAIAATGAIARHLGWSGYFALVLKYLKAAKTKDDSVRVHMRTLVSVLENFHFSMEEVVLEVVEPALEEGEAEAGGEGEEAVEAEAGQVVVEPPATKQPQHDVKKVADAVHARLMPSLLQFLANRDDAEENIRIPVSIGIAKIVNYLPPSMQEAQAGRLLTVLSQILRSKSSETRDLTRDAVCRIAVLLGPKYLPIVFRELRAALLRGPQLHVLAYVAHAVLIHVTAPEAVASFGNLDTCVPDIAHVASEVVLGASGKDVQNEGFKTKMREVKSSASKSLDSFALVAKHVTPKQIEQLLLPVRGVMQETGSLKALQQAEEVLRRVAGGINSSALIQPAELLTLCHTFITQNAKFLQEARPQEVRKKGKRKKDQRIVDLKRKVVAETDHYANNSFRFIVFGIDMFNVAYRRGRFDFQDATVVSRLQPMVKAIGNTLYSNQSAVVTSGLKAAAAILKCPVNSLEKSTPVIVQQTLEIIKQTGSIESDLVQTALKTLATIIRDCPAAQLKEKELIFLLEFVAPDLEDHTRQASVFALLRAIVSRKFVAPEIYDLMERVTSIMVTSQSSHVREQCRGLALQFLLDYPQGKGRMRNQMVFLAKNLSYTYESGRLSVLELLGVLLAKLDAALVHEYADLIFAALVMTIANDDSPKCRESAAGLVKVLVRRLDEERRRMIANHLHVWAEQDGQQHLRRVAVQVYGLVVDVLGRGMEPYVATLLEDMSRALEQSAEALQKTVDEDEEADGMDIDSQLDWQVPYQALSTLVKVLKVFPEFVSPATDVGGQSVPWQLVEAHLLFPHAWVRTAACRLLGTLFSSLTVSAPSTSDDDSTDVVSLVRLKALAGKLCAQLKSPHLDEALGLQVVKNLFFIGKCFALITSTIPSAAPSDGDEDDGVDAEADGSDASGDDEEEEGNDAEKADQRRERMKRNPRSSQTEPLPWLFSRLSFQARSAHIARRNKSSAPPNWIQQPTCVFRWFAAMTSHLDGPTLERFLPHMLSPMYRVSEDDTIRDPHMEELKTLASELQDMIQAKVGTTQFATAYSKIRQGVMNVRQGRRTARATQFTTNPEAAARRKIQRNVSKKDSRKRKNSAFADNKGRLKRQKEAA